MINQLTKCIYIHVKNDLKVAKFIYDNNIDATFYEYNSAVILNNTLYTKHYDYSEPFSIDLNNFTTQSIDSFKIKAKDIIKYLDDNKIKYSIKTGILNLFS